MLVRSENFRASKIMEDRVRNTANIEILLNTETVEVLGDGQVVSGVMVSNNVTKEQREIPATGFFVAIGHKPNTDIFNRFLELDETGYIINVPILQNECGRGICCRRCCRSCVSTSYYGSRYRMYGCFRC